MKNLKKLKVMNKSMKTVFYERKIASKEKEKAKYDKKLSTVKKNTFVVGREKKIEKLSEKIEKLDEDITSLNFAIADSIDEQLMNRAKYALKRWTGAEFETEKQKLDEKFGKSSKVKKQQTKSEKTKKETTDALDDLIKSGALDNKEEISEATIKELKKILKVDKQIRDELKEIKENQIDEQDTRIKEKKKAPKVAKVKDLPTKGMQTGKGMQTAKANTALLTTILGTGGAAAILAKLFNDYMKEHGDELIPQWIPDWVKDLTLDDVPEVATGGAKAAVTAAKAASTAKRGATNATKKAIKKVSSNRSAKNATKKILKREANYAAKNSVKETTKKTLKAAEKAHKKLGVKVGGVVYKRIAGETTEVMTKRIAGEMMERAAVKAAGKKIPIAGVSVAFGLAYIRWEQGDIAGAIGEVVSGVASIFPGVGTAVSFATDAVLIWRDVAGIVEKIEAREAEAKLAQIRRSKGIQKLVAQKKEQSQVKKLASEVDSRLAGDEHYQTLKKESGIIHEQHKAMVNSGNYNSDEFKALTKKLNMVNSEIDKIRNKVKKSITSTDKYAKERKALVDASKALGDYVKKYGANASDAEYIRLQSNMQQKSDVLQSAIHSKDDAENKKYLAEATAEYDRLHPRISSATIGKSSLNQVFNRNTQMSKSSDKILLDRIAKGEGTLKHGYDTTFSYGKYDPVNRPISTMTLGEIKQFQNGMIANGAPSSAVGRYQFIRKTLKEVQRQMGLSDDTVFDAKTQDDMIVYRLNKMRNMDKWKAGKMSDDKFQLGLSQEFASIANPYTGTSYYGQPTGTSSAEIQKAMSAVKNGTPSETFASNVIIPEVNKDAKDLQAMASSQNLTRQTVAYDSKVQSSKQIDSAQKVAKANQAGSINSQNDADVTMSHGFTTAPVQT